IRYGQEKRVDYPLTEEDKKRVRKMQKEMTEMVLKESIPPPTKIKPKCKDCEFWFTCKRA
ncbi:MAG: Dna2/Cas4 domain-containing protein, partial [Promethearchaeota archaeon]